MTLSSNIAWRAGAPTLLSINNYHYRRGGADVVFFEQNRMLQELNWNVASFSMHHPENIDSSWSKYFVDEIEFGHEYSVWQKLVQAQKVIYSFEARRKLNSLINDANPQVAHIHNIYHHISPSILGLLKKRGIPTVLTLHDLKLACPAYKMLAHDGICERCKPKKTFNVIVNKCIKGSVPLSALVYLESLVHQILRSYNNVSRFIVPSRFYLEKMVEWGWDRSRFSYIPNFVDCEQYQPSHMAGKPFVFFGRLSHEKGVHTLIKAAAMANVPVHIAGTGPEEQALKELAVQTGANVSFMGYHTGEDLYNIVRNARAVVLPSEWYENAPISVMEAYALGRPVLGANIGGIPELIRIGETGDVFISGSVEDLASKLVQYTNLPDDDLVEMGRQGRAWIKSEFSASKYRDRLLEVYADIGGPATARYSEDGSHTPA